MTDQAGLIRTVDGLEEKSIGPVTLDQVVAAAGCEQDVRALVAEDVLLGDQRLRLDSATGEMRPVRLCRLNRQHPAVRDALG